MLLNSKSSDELKQKLFHAQGGCCKLCKNEFDGPYNKQHLDHDHALEGRNAGKVRGLLCARCNMLEGMIKHKFIRSGLRGRDVDYIEWMRELIEYVDSDYSDNPVHSQYLSDMVKQFSKKSLPDMRLDMQERGFDYNDKDVKAELIKKFRKQFKKAIQ
ncbi:endonuclease [Aeromonas phage SW69-9]|nr:endonuclease [Aeromonas phage SW69-9]